MSKQKSKVDEAVVEQLKRELGWHEWNARRGVEARWRCEYCDRPLLASVNDYDAWHLDHLRPLSQKGDDTYENTVLCCKTCDGLKRSYVPLGKTRAEQIADARRYVLDQRAAKLVELEKVQIIVEPTQE